MSPYYKPLEEWTKVIQQRFGKYWNIDISSNFFTSFQELKESLSKQKVGAYYISGLLYCLGIGFRQDFGEAIKYLRYAARENHFLATFTLQDIYERGFGVVTDCLEVLKWQVHACRKFHLSSIVLNKELFQFLTDKFSSVGWYCHALEDVYNFCDFDKIENKNHKLQAPKRKVLLKELENKYNNFLFDMGGVITDGIESFPYGVKTINQLALNSKKKIVFISNSARPSSTVKDSLKKYGINEKLLDEDHISVITAGELVRQDLQTIYFNKKIYHFSFGNNKNEDILKGINISIVDKIEEADLILLTQFVTKEENKNDDQLFEEYDTYLEQVAEYTKNTEVPILCVNPDIECLHGLTTKRYCAGAFAERLKRKYKVDTQKIIYYGKPDPKIYRFLMDKILNLSSLDLSQCIMIGDTLDNDILGAQQFGIDSMLVLTGNARQEAKRNNRNEQDIWDLLTDRFDKFRIKPTYFMESLTDHFGE